MSSAHHSLWQTVIISVALNKTSDITRVENLTVCSHVWQGWMDYFIGKVAECLCCCFLRAVSMHITNRLLRTPINSSHPLCCLQMTLISGYQVSLIMNLTARHLGYDVWAGFLFQDGVLRGNRPVDEPTLGWLKFIVKYEMTSGVTRHVVKGLDNVPPVAFPLTWAQ